MKILSFIKWHICKITLDMFLWGVFCFCGTAYMNTQNQIYLNIAQALFLYGFGKFTIYIVKESYNKFEKEQQGLFDTIKNSDKS
jgi:hypothetical protein